MDWANEDYVRMYTRETSDDLELSWQAMALWRAMLCKFDRAGVLAVRNGWASVSRLVRIPADVVANAGAELLRDGRVTQTDCGFFAPNFTVAQTTPKSDKARQQASRDRRREDAERRQLPVTNAMSHDVTDSHVPSRNVTLTSATLADPKQHNTLPIQSAAADLPPPDSASAAADAPTAEPLLTVVAPPVPAGKRRQSSAPTAEEMASVRVVLDKLGAVRRCNFRGAAAHVDLIVARLRDGVSEADLRAVIAYCAAEWEDKPKMHKYLRPETLFGPESIERYLDPARDAYAAEISALAAQPKLEVVK